MTFALGPAMTVKRNVVQQLGGFGALGSFLAEDFVIGRWVHNLGYKVVLSSQIVEHHIGNAAWQANLEHRLRWARSTRRSRPLGYIGEIFTNPLPLALGLVAVDMRRIPLLAAIALLRALSNLLTSRWILDEPLPT